MIFAESAPAVPSSTTRSNRPVVRCFSGVQRKQIRRRFHGMGFVVPTKERGSIIAGSFSSHKYPHRAPAGWALLRIFVGGARATGFDRSAGRRAFCVRYSTNSGRCSILKGRTVGGRNLEVASGMPQYHLGHLDRLAQLNAAVDREPTWRFVATRLPASGCRTVYHTGEEAAEKGGKVVRIG